MYRIEKTFEISGSHQLSLPYQSKCGRIHGHNWNVTVFCKSKTLNSSGMIVDFTEIKEKVFKALDHKHLNDVFEFNPTAENIACWICKQIPSAYKVRVAESLGNIAEYEKSESLRNKREKIF